MPPQASPAEPHIRVSIVSSYLFASDPRQDLSESRQAAATRPIDNAKRHRIKLSPCVPFRTPSELPPAA
ncbi:hypothetical protein BGLA2_580011 [Burkholderia gladioli]|nr:hypothetical protein BGLA2_580011 [Burkholderia gladioli]